MRTVLALAFAGVALTAGVAAYAQSAAPSPVARPAQELTRASVETRAAKIFARMDRNSDGKLDPADRAVVRQSAFDRLDADDNGAISPSEFSAGRDQRREARSDRMAARLDRSEARGSRAGRGGPLLRGMLRGQGLGGMADANRDGAVSRAEFTTAALTRFDSADADKDGRLTGTERRQQRGRRGPGPVGNAS